MAGLALGCTGSIDTVAPSGGQGGTAGSSSGRPVGSVAGTGTTMGVGGSAAGSVGGASDQAGSGTGGTDHVPIPDGDGNLPYVAPTPGAEALRARTWKLSHVEYARSVAALLGVTPDVSDLEPEIDNGVYPNMSGSGIVRVTLANGYYAKAEQITAALTPAQLNALSPSGTLLLADKARFLAQALERAFRRPATPAELESYGSLFDLGASAGDVSLGFRAVLRGLLTSPAFLYRSEIGADASATRFSLTDHEVASLLSYSLLGTPPSAGLLAAAARGELTTAATLASHVSALLALPEAKAQLAAFASQWLKVHHFDVEVEKDEVRFPAFAAVKNAMRDETLSFLADYAGASGTLSALLTTPLPRPAGSLGDFYASDPSGTSGGTRTGVLALGALMSARAKPTSSSPTLRGLFVRDRFLCQQIHLPDDQPPDISETQMHAMPRTTRELYELHAGKPACAGCHLLLDSVGFTFEDLDAAGRFRTTENGYPIDTSGELLNTDVNGLVRNHTELAHALARSEWVRECVATQAFRFYFGVVEGSRGAPPVQAGRVAIGSGTFRDLVAAVLSSSTTFQRVRQ